MHLGIDLGTSNSAVAGNVNSQIRIFKNKRRQRCFAIRHLRGPAGSKALWQESIRANRSIPGERREGL